MQRLESAERVSTIKALSQHAVVGRVQQLLQAGTVPALVWQLRSHNWVMCRHA